MIRGLNGQKTAKNTVANQELIFTPDGISTTRGGRTTLKPSTKYGIITNVTQKGSAYFEIDFGNTLGAGGFYKNMSLGNNKVIGVTPSTIAYNRIIVQQSVYPVGQICKTISAYLNSPQVRKPTSPIEDQPPHIRTFKAVQLTLQLVL